MKEVFKLSKSFSILKPVKKYISESPWIQPFLIVGLIFAVIFSLTLFKDGGAINTWFNNIFNKQTCEGCTPTTLDTIDTKISGNESFILIFTADDCSACTSAYPIFNRYLSDNKDQPFYTINVTSKTDEKTGDLTYNDSKLTQEKLNKIGETVDTYLRSENRDNDLTLEGSDHYFQTPTIVLFKDGKVIDVSIGLPDGGGYLEFDKFINQIKAS